MVKRALIGLLCAGLLVLGGGAILAATEGGDTEQTGPDEPRTPAATVYATATVRERAVEAATVTVVDRATIEASGASTVADVLTFVPGLSFLSNGTRGGLTAVQIRGGDPNFTQVLLDGVSLNDGTYQVGEVFNFEALPVDAVERVEVVRGPLSSFYGSTGLAGTIQIITRLGKGPPGGELGIGLGDAGFRRATASSGGGGHRADHFVSVVGEQESGRVAEERYALRHLQARGRFAVGRSASVRLAGRFASWEGDDYAQASGGPALGSGALRRTDNGEGSFMAELSVQGRGDRLHRLSASTYLHDLDRESPAIPPLVPASVEQTRFTRSNLSWVSAWSPRESVELGFGVDAEREKGINQSLLMLPPALGGATAGDYSLARTTAGAYSELVARSGRVTVEAGLRIDLPEQGSEQLSPRLAVAYAFGNGTRLRGSLARAFKLPSFFALASPPALGGNPGLEPEIVVGGDLGLELESGRAGLKVTLGLFAQRFENLVDFDFDTFSHVNRSEVDAHGAEFGLTWRPGPDLTAALTATWQEVEDTQTGQPLRHRPRWVGALRGAWQATPALHLQADLRLASGSLDQQIPVPDRSAVEGHELIGLAARCRLSERSTLIARLDNLTDESYETLIGFPGPGRSGRVELRWRFGGDRGRP